MVDFMAKSRDTRYQGLALFEIIFILENQRTSGSHVDENIPALNA